MTNPWKWIALGLIGMIGIVGTSTLTTAYLMRPPAVATTSMPTEATGEHRAPIVRVAPSALSRAATVSSQRLTRAAAVVANPAPMPTATVTPVVSPPSVAATPSAPPDVPAANSGVAQRTAAVTPPADCSTGGDRALRIAKPGALGALLGAGLGAAGGAIADGGKAAGKGALIGGIAGAALGTGYGAYKTNSECGTVFGGSPASPTGVAAPPAARGDGGSAASTPRIESMAPARAPVTDEGRIQVYGVR